VWQHRVSQKHLAPGLEVRRAISAPSGRLPVTFYQSAEQLPAFTDYSMEGRTYRYSRATLVVQLYASLPRAGAPVRSLWDFQRVSLNPGEATMLTFTLDAKAMSIGTGMASVSSSRARSSCGSGAANRWRGRVSARQTVRPHA
jgi:beta-glucosidase